ncbi:MAG TPA: hypothetical protein VNV63_08165, partial [Nitrospiria bacterium]|nr:hypothetical protein [Nitrospiria bacterium]
LNIKWGAQCTLFLGSEPDMVKLAADSGCVAMFVGLESISEDVLTEMNKPFNKEKKYEDQIKCFHDHGIMVNPGIIFGADGDDESVFENTVEFLVKNRVELAYINISTPLPGTALFDRLKADGRIFDWDWSKYDGKHVVYYPKRMTPEVLQEGFYWANRQFFSIPSIATRMSSTSQRFMARWMMNWRFRHLIYRTCPKGRISPLSRVIKTLHDRLPSIERDQFIPNALHALKEKVETVSVQIDRFLQIKVKKSESQQSLTVELDGTLDRLNVKELKKRIEKAADKAKLEIIVNFENLKHATPAALQMLLEGDYLKKVGPYAKIKYRNLQSSFRAEIDSLVHSGVKIPQEDP